MSISCLPKKWTKEGHRRMKFKLNLRLLMFCFSNFLYRACVGPSDFLIEFANFNSSKFQRRIKKQEISGAHSDGDYKILASKLNVLKYL